MKNILLILFIFASVGLAEAKNAIEEPFVVNANGVDLHGTLLIPGKGSHWPVALIIAGSGPTDRNGNSAMIKGDNNSLRYLAEALTAKGIATLRFDKRGVGESKAEMKEEDMRFGTMVDDASAFIKKLEGDSRFLNIIIIGHSEGSLVGMMAAYLSQKVSHYVSLAGAGYPIDQILNKQICAQSAALCPEMKAALEKIKRSEPLDSVNPLLASILRPSVQPYIRSWMALDPQVEIAKLKCQVMIINGTSDIQVGMEQAEGLHAARQDANYLIIEEMNHVLKESGAGQLANMATYTDPSLPVKKELVKGIVAFVKN
jgi:uncharacterized protein